ncbi:MAG: hypothetical protein H7X80_00520 [bacterium]|nr:hypothetical protein [Candidatus Kapabacteria bacterium]
MPPRDARGSEESPSDESSSDESTVDAARRMGVSRDNVDLRRRMDDAARRDKKQK